MKRIIPILALAAAATVAGSPLTTSATGRPAVQNVAPVPDIQVTSRTLLSNGKYRYWLDGSASYDPDGTITSHYWEPDAYCRTDGAYSTTYYMDVPDGEYCTVGLTVTDNSNGINTLYTSLIGGD